MRDPMITLPTIVVTSLGRTGTKFFQLLFDAILPQATSLHEPDYLNFGQYEGTGTRIAEVARQIREAGARNMLVRKPLGRWSLVALSDARLRGELSDAEAAQRVLQQRRDFVRAQRGAPYIESSSAYYGLIDVLPHVFQRHRVAYILRDGRSWVRSKMNWGNMYDKRGLRRLVSRTWPTALDLPDDPYRERWEAMSRFERICWSWTRLNEQALLAVERNPDARTFKFEEIFKSEERYTHLETMVEFLVALPGMEGLTLGPLDGWLDRKVHQSEARFPAWEGWTAEHRRQFTEICGPLMERAGYA